MIKNITSYIINLILSVISVLIPTRVIAMVIKSKRVGGEKTDYHTFLNNETKTPLLPGIRARLHFCSR